MSQETEVVRIEGNVTIPKEIDFSVEFELFRNLRGYQWNGNIVPFEDPTGFALYKVEEVENYKREIDAYIDILNEKDEKERANKEAFKKLAEELAQERESVQRWKDSYEQSMKIRDSQRNTIKVLNREKTALEKRVELHPKINWYQVLMGLAVAIWLVIIGYVLFK